MTRLRLTGITREWRFVIQVMTCMGLAITGQAGELEIIKSFGYPDPGGTQPLGRLLLASDGMLYGTTYSGGVSNVGTVYRLETNGANFQVIHSFGGPPAGGNAPTAGVIEGSDGLLYGTTTQGGVYSNGMVYRLEKNGSNYAVLISFTGTNESYPASELIEASDGALYGTCRGNDPGGRGVVFKVNRDGTGYTNLHTFTGAPDGQYPYAGVIESTNGMLYGTAYAGGSTGRGTLYSLNKDGSGFAVLLHFSGDLQRPAGPVIEAPNGLLFGTTIGTGTPSGTSGWVYRINKNGSGLSSLLNTFSPSLGGTFPSGHLALGIDGKLYGVAGGSGDFGTFPGSVFRVPFSVAEGFVASHLIGFSSNAAPYSPKGGVAVAGDGTIFGVHSRGGVGDSGAVFMRLTNGVYSNLHLFGASRDGLRPNGSLLAGRNGRLFGTTQTGGIADRGTGDGACFSLNPDGSDYSVLRFTDTNAGDGLVLSLGLTEGSDAMLYGWTRSGGSNNGGVLFRMMTNGAAYSVLRNFDTPTGAGNSSLWPLIETTPSSFSGFRGMNSSSLMFRVSSDGTLLETNRVSNTESGSLAAMLAGDGLLRVSASGGGPNSRGVVYHINPDGAGFVTLVSFPSATDGSSPRGPVVEGGDGRIYGSTVLSGASSRGTLFGAASMGSDFSVVHQFSELRSSMGIEAAVDGHLYGAAALGDFSTALYRVQRDGSNFTVLATIPNSRNNWPGPSGVITSLPDGRLVEAASGQLFGASREGGIMNFGFLYRFTPGTPPAVVTTPLSIIGPLGAPVELTGAVPGQMDRTYQWLLNGVSVVGATNDSLSLLGNTPGNAGAYQLAVTTANGSTTSVVATVTYQDFQWIADQPWLTLHGPAGAAYQLDYRDSLTNDWQFWTNLTLTNGVGELPDTDANTLTQRVYRSGLLP